MYMCTYVDVCMCADYMYVCVCAHVVGGECVRERGREKDFILCLFICMYIYRQHCSTLT